MSCILIGFLLHGQEVLNGELQGKAQGCNDLEDASPRNGAVRPAVTPAARSSRSSSIKSSSSDTDAMFGEMLCECHDLKLPCRPAVQLADSLCSPRCSLTTSGSAAPHFR